jgi:hypothetical protein
VRGLALLGPLAEGVDGDEGLELVTIGRSASISGRLRLPMVRVYDPDRRLERLRLELTA